MPTVLARQLRRHGLDAHAPPGSDAAWRGFLESVRQAYHQAEQDRYLLERSLALSSEEMAELHRQLASERDFITRVTCSLAEGVCALDNDGRVLFMNPKARRLLRLAEDAAVAGRLLGELVSAHDGAGRPIDAVVAGPAPHGADEPRLVVNGDDSTFVTFRISPLGEQGEGVVLTLHDISERHRMEAEGRELTRRLEVSEQRYALAARGASDGLWDWDLAANRVYYSARWRRILGLGDDAHEDGPEAWLSRVHPNDISGVRAAIEGYLAGDAERLETEHRLRRADGRYLWILCRGLAVHDAQGRPARMAGSISDISRRKETEDELRRGAYFDKLTGLPNRDLFRECLEQVVAEARGGPGERFALLFLDFDNFKVINDSLGHLAGDELLVGISARLSAVLKQSAAARDHTLARLGGDEFVVLLKHAASTESATAVAATILQALEKPFTAHGAEVHSTASIGIAVDEGNYLTPDEALRDADTAMYHAKAAGPGRYCLCDEPMRQSAVARLKLENELRRAIQQEDIEIAYQPIMNLESGRPTAVEALARWTAEGGPVSPDRFIPLAEETGLIVPLGEHVLRAACRDLRTLRTSGEAQRNLRVNVNLSGRQFAQSDLVDVVMAALRDHGLPPEALALEVTETVVMEDFDAASATIRRLRDLGIEVYMDDFGTGYSSLSCLKLLPLTGLKLDRAFLTHFDGTTANPAIIHAIVTLANHLRLRVVAEGVETHEHLASVLALECGHAQGYLFGRPMMLPDLHKWLDEARGKRRAA